MIPLDAVKWVGDQILSLHIARDDQNMILKTIQLHISSLSSSLKTSIQHYDLNRRTNPDGTTEVSTLENFNQLLKDAHKVLSKISGRSCLIRYIFAKKDLQTLQQCEHLIKSGVDVIRAEKDIIQLALVKESQTQKMNQYKVLNKTMKNAEAQEFWTTHIGLSSVSEKIDVVITKFYSAEFCKLPKHDEIKKPYAMIKLAEYLDKDGDGVIDLNEFNKFYEETWSHKNKQEEIVKEILEEQDQPLKNTNQIMASILSECDLAVLLTKFISMGLNSRSFLKLDLQSLQKIVSLENSIKIFDAIQQHNDMLQKFLDIKAFLISVRDYAYGIRQRYLANPKDWEKGITGVCKLRWCICEAFKGKIYGPYIRDDEISYGFIISWDPDKNYNPLNQYIANFGEPSNYKYKRFLMETYSYWDRDKVYTYQQVSNFEEAFVIKRKFDKDDEDYIRPYAHGPTLYRDKNGNQARIYYYQNHEMSMKEFEQKAKEEFMYPKFKLVKYKY